MSANHKQLIGVVARMKGGEVLSNNINREILKKSKIREMVDIPSPMKLIKEGGYRGKKKKAPDN